MLTVEVIGLHTLPTLSNLGITSAAEDFLPYFVLFGILAIWVLFDGLGRKMAANAVMWSLGTALLGALVIPFYLAKRPLKIGEVREGGVAWNVLKNFAILWTVIMAAVFVVWLKTIGDITRNVTSSAAMAGTGIGMVLGFAMLGAVWFLPTFGAALLGFLMKKNSLVEVGPTGALNSSDSKASMVNGWAGVLGCAVIAIIVISVVGNSKKPISTNAQDISAEPSTPASEPMKVASWQVQDTKTEMDGIRETSLSLASENEIEGFIGSHKGYLGIRCSKGKPDVYVNIGGPFESVYGEFNSVRVRLKLDQGSPSSQNWIESTSRNAAFASSPVKLIKQLAGAKTLLFEFTPFEKRETTLRFDLGDLGAKLSAESEVCGWK